MACIKEYILGTKCGSRNWWFSKKEKCFQKCMMKGIHPYHLLSGIVRGSLVLGRASGVGSAGLGVSRKDCLLI
jgi:hypothetical protein